ncbi:hypothetical protein D3C81_570180 [compost metagenome]
MSPRHQMVQAQWRHVVHRSLARAHHHPDDGLHRAGIGRERQRRPVRRDVLGRLPRIPRKTPEGVPVGLVEVRSTPGAVGADVGDPGHAGQGLRHGGPLAACAGVGPQHFLVQRPQVNQMRGKAQVLLGDLHFHHQRRARHGSEQRMERLTRLEVDGPVLHLQDHVRAKGAVQAGKFAVGLRGPVGGNVVRIDEGAPHHHAAVRGQYIGQQVGAVGVRAAIVLRAGLPFRIGFHQEAAEVGNACVDLGGLVPPPALHARVERIGGVEPAQLDGSAEACAQVDADAVRPEQIRQCCRFVEIFRRKTLCVCIHVVEHGAVDAYGRIGACVVGVARVAPLRQRLPVPQ